MSKLKIRKNPNRLSATAEELIADYKFRRFDKHKSWDEYIKDKSLMPEINAKEFFKLYELTLPKEFVLVSEIEFSATHYDTLRKTNCQIKKDKFGVYNIVWQDGSYGSNPPSFPPSDERFLEL